MTENFRVLLRCVAAGDTMILETKEGKYISIDCKGMKMVPKGTQERTIESRLQYELYGEYPLSEKNQRDWKLHIKDAFNYNED